MEFIAILQSILSRPELIYVYVVLSFIVRILIKLLAFVLIQAPRPLGSDCSVFIAVCPKGLKMGSAITYLISNKFVRRIQSAEENIVLT
jgi:hypothetical protein